MTEQSHFFKNIFSAFYQPNGKQNLVIFLLCLFCSASFWLFIKLSRDAQASFVQPISIVNVSEENVLSSVSHTAVRVTVQAPGIRLLLGQFFHSGDTLHFDANQMQSIQKGGELWHYLSSTQIRSSLARLPLVEGAIVGVAPDTIFAQFAFASIKKVPVRFTGTLSFAQSMGQIDAITLIPDSVTVRGPRQIVDTLRAVYTVPYNLNQLNQTVEQNIHLQNPAFAAGVSLSLGQVAATIPVGELRETTLDLPISIQRKLPEQRISPNILLFPSRVSVQVRIPIKMMQDVDLQLVEVFVECPFEVPPDGNRLKLNVTSHSPFVTIIRVDPPMVEFVISN
ncbi:MAG TPA: hypothetical protein DCM62_07865 [Bacteroidales bacterium]|nr:hypothetical protein [Bacteroidales bacterium]